MDNFRRRFKKKTRSIVPTTTGIYLFKESGQFVSPPSFSGDDAEWSLRQWAVANKDDTEAIVVVQDGRYYAIYPYSISGKIAMQNLSTDIARSASDGMANTSELITDPIAGDSMYPGLIANRVNEMNNNSASNVRGGYPIAWYIPAMDEFKAPFTGNLSQDLYSVLDVIAGSPFLNTNFGTSTLTSRNGGYVYRPIDNFESFYSITSDVDIPLFFQFK